MVLITAPPIKEGNSDVYLYVSTQKDLGKHIQHITQGSTSNFLSSSIEKVVITQHEYRASKLSTIERFKDPYFEETTIRLVDGAYLKPGDNMHLIEVFIGRNGSH